MTRVMTEPLDGWIYFRCECGLNIGHPCNLGGWGITVINRPELLAYFVDHNGLPGHSLTLFVEGVDKLLKTRSAEQAGVS